MLSMTPTKLADYLLCPYKYKLKHVERAGSYSGSAALSFGISFHKALQDLHSANEQLLDPVEISELLERHWDQSGYIDRNEDDSFFARGCQALSNYCRQYPDPNEETIGTEVYMSYILKTGDLQVRLGCKADRVCAHPDGSLEIIDYKTSASGKVSPEESLRSDLPTFLYYALARVNYPEYKQEVQISFLNVLTLSKSIVKYSPEEVATNKQALLTCLQAASADSFTPRPSEACSWCQFQDVCPATNKLVDLSLIT